MRPTKSLFRDKKGIDTILAALLMVVIVVVASVMVYAWSTGLLGSLLVTPPTGKEALNLENTAFASNTQVTLYIRNSGTASISLITYYVKDSSNNQWSMTSWTGPVIPVNGLGQAVVNIASPATCSPTPCAFTSFVTGNSYTVIAVTSRNNQFTFTVVR